MFPSESSLSIDAFDEYLITPLFIPSGVGFIYVIVASWVGAIQISGIQYLIAIVVPLILSIISQVGDFAASSIKRFADAKDYGSLLPGHGGMLDRIDSVIFIAPFVYMIMIVMQQF